MLIRLLNFTGRDLQCGCIVSAGLLLIPLPAQPTSEVQQPVSDFIVPLNFSINSNNTSISIGTVPYVTSPDNYMDIVVGSPPQSFHENAGFRQEISKLVFVWYFLRADNTTHFLGAVPRSSWESQ